MKALGYPQRYVPTCRKLDNLRFFLISLIYDSVFRDQISKFPLFLSFFSFRWIFKIPTHPPVLEETTNPTVRDDWRLYRNVSYVPILMEFPRLPTSNIQHKKYHIRMSTFPSHVPTPMNYETMHRSSDTPTSEPPFFLLFFFHSSSFFFFFLSSSIRFIKLGTTLRLSLPPQ